MDESIREAYERGVRVGREEADAEARRIMWLAGYLPVKRTSKDIIEGLLQLLNGH